VDNGAQAFIVSSDPFFTSKAKKLYKAIKDTTLPACYPFKEYIEEPANTKYISYGPLLTDAYEMLGQDANTIRTGGTFPTLGTVNPQQVPP
jgi:hypothetical protein